MNREFHYYMPTRIHFGSGRLQELTGLLDPAWKRILVVSDRGVAECGLLDRVKKELTGREVGSVTEISVNPSFTDVEAGAVKAREFQPDLIVGLGGGSPMDAAKGIAMLAANPMRLRDLLDGLPRERDPLPVVCIPTTSGTGSEVTPYAVFTDLENGNKCGYADEKIFPRLALVDPALTFSMPTSLVVNTGLDVLTHALESYLSVLAFPFTDALAMQALEVVTASLPAAAAHDRSAQEKMAYAAAIAGITIANAGTILLHVQAYPLTVFHGIPHGRANAILLPRFLDFLRRSSSVPGKLERIDAIFAPYGGVAAFLASLGVSTDLRDYGVQAEEIPMYVRKTIVKSDVPLTPAPVSEADIASIYGM